MLNQLGAMETDMRNANAAMAGELAPLARQKAQKVIDDGRQIEHIDGRINRFITDIQNKLKQIENLACERIDETKELIKDQVSVTYILIMFAYKILLKNEIRMVK